MGYAVQTKDGIDVYETAVHIELSHLTVDSQSAYLYVRDEEETVVAIYPPFKWLKVGVTSARTYDTQGSVPLKIPPLDTVTSNGTEEKATKGVEVK